MKRYVEFMLSAALLVLVQSSIAGPNDPLDFEFRISGEPEARPSIVFTDGDDTYIQPNESSSAEISINGAEWDRQGPYLVIRGVPKRFMVVAGKKVSTVVYAGKPKPAGETKSEAAQFRAESDVVGSDCVQKVDAKKTAFVVQFGESDSRLSSAMVNRIVSGIGAAGEVDAVRIIGEGRNAVEISERQVAIRDVLVMHGVSPSRVTLSSRRQTGIGTEVWITRSVVTPCSSGVVKVSGIRDEATVVWSGDVLPLIKTIASQLKGSVKTTGKVRPVSVEIDLRGRSLIQVLGEVGRLLGDEVDIVLDGVNFDVRYQEARK